MDYQAIVNLVSSVGFPIFMCLYLINNQGKQMAAFTEAINKLTDKVDTMVESDTALKETITRELNSNGK